MLFCLVGPYWHASVARALPCCAQTHMPLPPCTFAIPEEFCVWPETVGCSTDSVPSTRCPVTRCLQRMSCMLLCTSKHFRRKDGVGLKV